MIIGFERDVSVEEDAGSVEVCVGVLNLEEDDPFIASIPLLIETIPGTAGKLWHNGDTCNAHPGI